MNAVEIEEAVSKLADAPFNAETFPYDFLQAFGINDAASANSGAATQTSPICPAACFSDKTTSTSSPARQAKLPPPSMPLRAKPRYRKHKAKFILATDGQTFQAERFEDGEALVCAFMDCPNHFGFFSRWRASPPLSRLPKMRSTSRPPAG